MADSFPACLAFTLQAEGGWVDDSRDKGGCTNQGITLPVFCQWKHNPYLSCDDLRVITAKEVHDLYQANYWFPIHAQSLPLGVDLMVFDAGVNMGISGSTKLLQRQVGTNIDGAMGPETLAAVLLLEPSTLVNMLAVAQTNFYEELSNFRIFGTGWLNRVNARRDAAVQMMSIT